MQRRLLVVWMLTAVAAAVAQTAPPPDEPNQADRRPAAGPERSFFGQLNQMVRGMREMGPWENQSQDIMSAVNNVYARNGWTSEPDQFSLKLVGEVSTIPPWNAQERMDKLMSLLGDRYQLTPEQSDGLRTLMIRETGAMLRDHANEIMQYSMEAIQARVRGEAFTPEQIQRWTKLAQPIFDDSRKRMDRAAGEFMQQLTPEQRTIAERDLDATRRRQDAVAEMGQHWLRGEWQPTDWGMDTDPIQNGQTPATPPGGEQAGGSGTPNHPTPPAASGNPPAGGAPPSAAPNPAGGPPGSPPPTDDTPGAPGAPRPDGGHAASPTPDPTDPWGQYVTAFIAKYKLSEAQTSVAWRIHGESKTRADQLRARYEEQIAALGSKSSSDAKEQIAAREKSRDSEIEATFERLKARLDKLPTRAQRDAAGEPAPTSRPAAAPAH